MSRPTIFIGSSSEGKQVADTLHSLLETVADPIVWDQGVFNLSSGTLEALIQITGKTDFAVLVLTGDDIVSIRSETLDAPRDNVIFELGLCMGSLGRDRTFMLSEQSPTLKLPSDLAGITRATYGRRADGNLHAALTTAALQIKSQIKSLGPRHPEAITKTLSRSSVKILSGDLTKLLRPGTTVLLPANVFFDSNVENNILSRRSTLGKLISDMEVRGHAAEFQTDLNAEIMQSKLIIDKQQKKIPKHGRQVAYEPGSTVQVTTCSYNVILCALTRMNMSGTNYVATLDEETLTTTLRKLWKYVESRPIRGELFMPIIGSGHGGITHNTALAHILLSYRLAEERAGCRLCDTLNVVVYHSDWKDGQWARDTFNALMA